MRKEVLVWILGFTMLTAGGCVTNGKYDSVVEQLTTIQRELRITQANGIVLTQLGNYSGSLSQDNYSLRLSCTFDFTRSWTALPRFCRCF